MHSAKLASKIREQIRRFSGEVSVGLPKTPYDDLVPFLLGLVDQLSVFQQFPPLLRRSVH